MKMNVKARKISVIFLLILMLCFAASCDKNGNDNTSEATQNESVTQTEQTTTSATETTVEIQPSSETEASTTETTEETASEETETDEASPTETTETDKPQPTEPAVPVFSPSVISEYVYEMLEGKMTFVNSEFKEITVESPPSGRSEDIQKKITPMSPYPATADYFENALFLGDSVTMGFEVFRTSLTVNTEKINLNYKVAAVKSYGVYNATRELSETSTHPIYMGDQMLPADIIKEYSAEKVFICLGLNDVGWETESQYIQFYGELINNIKESNPELKIIIMSVTPLTFEGQKENLNNEKIMYANELLIEFAAENGYPFIDYAAAIRDEENHLIADLSSDNYCHLKPAAYNRLLEYILYHPVS